MKNVQSLLLNFQSRVLIYPSLSISSSPYLLCYLEVEFSYVILQNKFRFSVCDCHSLTQFWEWLFFRLFFCLFHGGSGFLLFVVVLHFFGLDIFLSIISFFFLVMLLIISHHHAVSLFADSISLSCHSCFLSFILETFAYNFLVVFFYILFFYIMTYVLIILFFLYAFFLFRVISSSRKWSLSILITLLTLIFLIVFQLFVLIKKSIMDLSPHLDST